MHCGWLRVCYQLCSNKSCGSGGVIRVLSTRPGFWYPENLEFLQKFLDTYIDREFMRSLVGIVITQPKAEGCKLGCIYSTYSLIASGIEKTPACLGLRAKI